MLATDIIAKKRDSGQHSYEELSWFINSYVKGEVADYQVSAWLMAVVLNGMTFEETANLTQVMIASGSRFDLSSLAGKALVDKHSTGGVGDKISLPLAPLASAMGLFVPMMSGRALGITGGTLDKLESIPNYRTGLSEKEFVQFISENGYAMTGQTKEIVPADRLLYALRDVTSCVESVPLITASILSKKFAEGAESFVFDVKYGSGAFMPTPEAAHTLANSLVKTMGVLGRRSVALITNMDQPLGLMVGNFLEMEESYLCLKGEGPADVMHLVKRQAAYMALAGGVVKSVSEGEVLVETTLASGEPLKRFLKNITLQGGNADVFEASIGQRRATYWRDVVATQNGFVGRIDAGIIGHSGLVLGVGRTKTTDKVAALAGIEFFKKAGDVVQAGESLCRVYAESEVQLSATLPMVNTAFTLQNEKPADMVFIHEEILAL
jgi:pyrimidine-nucleoside phosphorylase